MCKTMKERNERKPLKTEIQPFLPEALTPTVTLKTMCEKETNLYRVKKLRDMNSNCNEEGNVFLYTYSYQSMTDFFKTHVLLFLLCDDNN